MVCAAAAVLSASLALALLRHSSPPTESSAISPFSFNTVLSILHDATTGKAQRELNNLLLKGCTPCDVSNHYSTLITSLLVNNTCGVSFTIGNRFILGDSNEYEKSYQRGIEVNYKLKADSMDVENKKGAVAEEMNKVIDQGTRGMIKSVIQADNIYSRASPRVIASGHFNGIWKFPFNPSSTVASQYRLSAAGEKKIDLMHYHDISLRVNKNNEFGTTLIVPYKDEQYRFFMLMSNENSNLERTRSELTGEKLLDILKNAQEEVGNYTVPKFKIEFNTYGHDVLTKNLGVAHFFHEQSLTKISDDRNYDIDTMLQYAVLETSEEGTVAAAATFTDVHAPSIKPPVFFDRPFIYGVLRNEDILFIGQLV